VPGQGRTVATVSAYLLNNARFNVLDYGAVQDTGINSTAAVQAAVDAIVLYANSKGIVFIPPDVKWDYTALVNVPRGSTTGIVFEDYSVPIFPKRWNWAYAAEEQLVGEGQPPDEVNGGPNVAWICKSIRHYGDPHGAGFVSRFGKPKTPGFPDEPYNVWQIQYGNWGNVPLTGAITAGLKQLVVTTNQFVAGDVGRVIRVAGAGAAGADLTTTIEAYTNNTTVTLATAAGTTVAAANVHYVNADDMVTIAYQAQVVYGGVARTPPTSPGTFHSRRIWGQNGVVIWNPSSSYAPSYDPIAAVNDDYIHVINPSSTSGATARVLLVSHAAGGAVGIDFRAGSDAKRRRLELDEASNLLRLRDSTRSVTLFQADDTGDFQVKGPLAVSGAAGTDRFISLRTAGVDRWKIRGTSTVEGGANAGTDLALQACTDAGAVIDNVITITRAAAGTIVINRPFVLNSTLQLGVALNALGGGAAPTLGTIGGTGPAVAAQNSWQKIKDSAGVDGFVPIWR